MRRYRESIEYAEREEIEKGELGDLRLRILAFLVSSVSRHDRKRLK